MGSDLQRQTRLQLCKGDGQLQATQCIHQAMLQSIPPSPCPPFCHLPHIILAHLAPKRHLCSAMRHLSCPLSRWAHLMTSQQCYRDSCLK